MPVVHVVGAGLAGLAAAVTLAGAGRAVLLHEAGAQAGGRCRSYFDRELGCRIDNGNHLLLSGNRAVMSYLGAIGATNSLTGPASPRFPFLDLASGERWTIELSRGSWPGWIWDPERRVPGTGALDYLGICKLAWAAGDLTVALALGGHGRVYDLLWRPFAVAALNTEAESASARLLWQVVRESLGRGGAACRPLVPRVGLSESLVDPALRFLNDRDMGVQLGRRLRRVAFVGSRVASLDFGDGAVDLGDGDDLILAVPAAVAADLVPEQTVPTEHRAIINAHYRMSLSSHELGAAGMLGLTGGLVEWIFVKREVISTTISAGDRQVDRPAEELAGAIWKEVARALDLDRDRMPPWRVVKERRATFAATPPQLRRRPGPATRWRNLWLAGDWTDTGLPGTIEGAVRSGRKAAARIVENG